MKNCKSVLTAVLVVAGILNSAPVKAGNPQRAGSSGAQELLINPWARSSGFGSANSAHVKGIESTFLNIAGLAFTEKTEIVFSNTNWLSGTDVSINTAGFSQKVGETGVLGVSIMSVDYGDIEITTNDQPDGGLGTYSPTSLNFNLSYAKKFTDNIYGGVNVKLISQSINDLTATGLAFDAGVQYVTGEEKNIRFGIAIRNVGPAMSFSGDGIAVRLDALSGSFDQTFESRSQSFEIPSNLNIGAAYDFLFENHRLTLAGNFTSNSFSKDQYSLGAEYAFMKKFMVRTGYTIDDNGDVDINTNALTGFAAGFSVELPFKKGGTSTIAIDYSYRDSDPFDGSHSIGFRVNL